MVHPLNGFTHYANIELVMGNYQLWNLTIELIWVSIIYIYIYITIILVLNYFIFFNIRVQGCYVVGIYLVLKLI